jgi:hypothetical protein
MSRVFTKANLENQNGENWEIIALTAVWNTLLEIPFIQRDYTDGCVVKIYLCLVFQNIFYMTSHFIFSKTTDQGHKSRSYIYNLYNLNIYNYKT